MNNYGDKKRSPVILVLSWLAAIASLFLLYGVARAMVSDVLGFRNCSVNDSGLSVVSCGRDTVTFGDVLLGVLVFLSVLLSISLLTAAWRASRRRKRV